MRRASWTGVAVFAIGFGGCLAYFWAARSHPAQGAEPSVNVTAATLERASATVPALPSQPPPPAPKLAATAAPSASEPVSPPTPPAETVETLVSVLSTDESDQNRRQAVAALRTLARLQGDENHRIRDALRRVMEDSTEVAPGARAAFDEIEAASATSPR